MEKIKLLIIGDNLKMNGGVVNYTRPLFKSFESLHNIEVKYFFSASFLFPEYNFLFIPYLKQESANVYKIINSKNLTYNYSNLELDNKSRKNDTLFRDLLKRLDTDVVHIHEIIGNSSNIVSIANSLSKKVFVTVHEYWWLCPHRVMVDYRGEICEGPNDFDKCAVCVLHKKVKHNSQKIKFKYRLFNHLPKLREIYSHYTSTSNKSYTSEELSKIKYSKFEFEKMKNHVMSRLNKNVNALNSTSGVICVSNDVARILERYGVQKNKLIVQHIGSEIASHQIFESSRQLRSQIIFGYIGGVGYYKGVHRLIEAIGQINYTKLKKIKVVIHGRGETQYIEYCQLLIKKYGLDDIVKLLGPFDRISLKSIIESIDIMVLPSMCADTAPQTIFESFAYKTPIIAPRIGGFSDFVIDNVNGFLYDPHTTGELAHKINIIIDSPTIIHKFSENIPKLKTINDNIQELMELYAS